MPWLTGTCNAMYRNSCELYLPPPHTIIMVTLAEGIFQISQTRVHSGEKTLLSPPSTLSAECLWTFSKVNAEEGTEA